MAELTVVLLDIAKVELTAVVMADWWANDWVERMAAGLAARSVERTVVDSAAL